MKRLMISRGELSMRFFGPYPSGYMLEAWRHHWNVGLNVGSKCEAIPACQQKNNPL